MSQAWLDSLSEDWVSQPASETSLVATGPLQTADEYSGVSNAASRSTNPNSSRIPRLNLGAARSSPTHNDSSNILSERSVNEPNPANSRRATSKLSREIKAHEHGRSRRASRSASGASTNSVVNNTINYRGSGDPSPTSKGQTPEWKRRLVYGDLSYGEQRDLFTSAGVVLENIFRPPPTPEMLSPDSPDQDEHRMQHEVTLPSSPPIYVRDPSTIEIHVDESAVEGTASLPEIRPVDAMVRREVSAAIAVGSDDEPVSPGGGRKCGHGDGSYEGGEGRGRVVTEARGDPQLRKISGQTDMENEDFSPILISRQNDSEGRPSFAPVEIPPDELRRRLEDLRRNQMLLDSGINSSLGGAQGKESNAFLIDDTGDYDKFGAFVNVHRGSRSDDGSFRARLSSSALNDVSELPDESLQASTPKQFPSLRVGKRYSATGVSGSPRLPRAPHPSPEKRPDQGQGPEQVQRSSGSPLKLFQPYDTFTNQTLLRRLSQFEDPMTDESQLPRPHSAELGEQPGGFSHEDDVGSKAALHHQQRGEGARLRIPRQPPASASLFGRGDLDGYVFEEDDSFQSNPYGGAEDKDSGPADAARKAGHPTFRLQPSSPPSQAGDVATGRQRQRSVTSNTSRQSSQQSSQTRYSESLSVPSMDQPLATPRLRQDAAFDGKRPRTTPAKDPTPKRRRTLHKSDIAYAAADQASAIETVQLFHNQMQSGIGKKRKDARRGDMQQQPTPAAGADGDMSCPRTPSPRQKLLAQRQQALAVVEEDAALSVAPDEAAAAAPATEPAPADTSRKPSIRTEDFINEANKIMAMIRNKAGLASGLASVEESALESLYQPGAEEDDDSCQESSREPFSRPPSREGRAPLPRMSARQEDPELALRLKKYEEASDMGDMISSSMRSLSLANRGAEQQAQGIFIDYASQAPMGRDFVTSDPQHMRISHNPDRLVRRSTESLKDGFSSSGTQASSGNLSSNSFPTVSSRGSDTRKTIAPESVEHLIPDQVGNMYLDRQRNIWVKRRQPRSSGGRRAFLPSEGSEDDPFADIPDLSVDMAVELQNLGATAAKSDVGTHGPGDDMSAPGLPPPTADASRPATATSAGAGDQSPAPDLSVLDAAASPAKWAEDADETLEDTRGEDVEHEISINDGRATTPKRRNLTITFSSPIASIIQDMANGADTTVEDSSLLEQPTSVSHSAACRGRCDASSRPDKNNNNTTNNNNNTTNNNDSDNGSSRGVPSRPRSSSRPTARQISVGGQTFVARPVSRIDERDEDSVSYEAPQTGFEASVVGDQSSLSRAGDQGQNSLSFLLTTPAHGRDCLLAGGDAAAMISQYVGTLSLSPLSEFTAHHGEQTMPLEVSYVVDDHRLVTGDRSRRTLSMSTRDLVQKLAEVEPFEPYWEDMCELVVHDKRLESLHALDEFCGHLERLDASNNGIRNLTGVPSSVRQLKMAHNCLTSLTAWGHLQNLQYVDVSNNGLTSLSCFKDLVHLRSLRADDNRITSLDSIKYHDGLQVLRLRGNAIEEVDLEGTRLQRLSELDLKNNSIRQLRGMQELPALTSLNLEGNQLESLEVGAGEPAASLRYLFLSGNKLRSVNLRSFPELRLLHADRNRLGRVSGFSKARRLDSLSLREQRGEGPLDVSFLSRAYEIRKLYLSGNLLENFDPQVDFLNLQLLELSNCGLQALPGNLGQLMPNLRVVNINFNAISDLSPLRYVPRLKRLLAAGNRLAKTVAAVNTLSEFPQLTAVDLRDNPMTQGFYASLQVLLRQEEVDAVDPFTLPGGDPERDAAYSSRLDLETRMRRRLYEQVLVESCRRLKMLDGLPLRRDIGELKDAVWTALVTQGLVFSEDRPRIRDVRGGRETREGGGYGKPRTASPDGEIGRGGGKQDMSLYHHSRRGLGIWVSFVDVGSRRSGQKGFKSKPK